MGRREKLTVFGNDYDTKVNNSWENDRVDGAEIDSDLVYRP